MRNYMPKIPKGVFLLFGLALLSLFFIDLVPPQAKTMATMHVAKERILQFAAEHDRLPKSLEETTPVAGKVEGLTDAWAHPILMGVDANGVVTLTSLGKGHLVGGTEAEADMFGQFASRNAAGNWASKDGDWLVELAVRKTLPKAMQPDAGI